MRPRRWVPTVAGGVLFGVALKLVMKSVVMPLFGADPVNQAFRYLAGNTAALPWVLYAVTVGAGFGEETIFRGFAFERLRRLFGTSAAATVVIIAFTAVWFGAEHYSLQGLARRAAGHGGRPGLRHRLRHDPPPADADRRPRRVRPHGRGADLLGAGNRRRPGVLPLRWGQTRVRHVSVSAVSRPVIH